MMQTRHWVMTNRMMRLHYPNRHITGHQSNLEQGYHFHRAFVLK